MSPRPLSPVHRVWSCAHFRRLLHAQVKGLDEKSQGTRGRSQQETLMEVPSPFGSNSFGLSLTLVFPKWRSTPHLPQDSP